MLARPRAVGDQPVRLGDRILVAIAGDVPDHDLVAFLDRPAADLGILGRGAPHMDDRSLPADNLGNEAWDQPAIGAHLRVLLGIAAEPPDAARHRVAGRVVAADQEQDQDSHPLAQRHPVHALAMREDRDDVEGGRPFGAVLPQLVHVLGELDQLGKTLFLGTDRRVRRVDVADRDLRPADQRTALLDWIVEQR